jgi:hypothetical protein
MSSTTTPIEKGMYAWNYIHAGSFLLFVEKLKHCYKFIMLPGPTDMFLTEQDFKKSIKANVLEFVDVLPDDIYEETIRISLSCPSQ